jgi:LysM domain
MDRRLIQCAAAGIGLTLALAASCAYLQPKDKPPPLPPIEETRPPLILKGDYFRKFPWNELAKPRKDGNDPDTSTYVVREDDTLESIARKEMGDASLASGLASYNELSSPLEVPVGDKLVIPDPIIGMSSQVIIKPKGEKEYGPPESFDVRFKKGDEFKMKFESNVDGYCYVFIKGAKGTEMLFPPKVKPEKKPGRRSKPTEPIKRESAEVKAYTPFEVPAGQKVVYNSKMSGDTVRVFLSLRPIAGLEDLIEKKKIESDELLDVMHRVKEGDIYRSEPPYMLLRASDTADILGFSLNIIGD